MSKACRAKGAFLRDKSLELSSSTEFTEALKTKPHASTSPASDKSRIVAQRIRQARNILVICHVMPDGDAIGSLLGLGWALHKLGKEHTLACADPVPDSFAYLPGSETIVAYPAGNHDLVISLDCSDLKRLGAAYDQNSLRRVPIINIDHHVTNIGFGSVNWVDPGSAATAQMVLTLIERLEVPLDPTMATCLLNGIVTDTRGFRTPNTTPAVMEAATRLMMAGASLPEITEQVFNRRPLAVVRLWGRALSAVQLDGRIIWTEISQAMKHECGLSNDSDDGLVSFLASACEADVGIVFTEKDDGTIDVSMRSMPGIDISSVAMRLGGGGHPQAAGCNLNSSLAEARERVLAELRHSLLEQTARHQH
ncbi:MAG TPA: bifunctional oligoribonuclease/PAP phosphatase NrnA [Anaerolineae bacterium]|nr:bifunctional oligoribonuclease/PAP phosphatase NrnA [Anaerolineae bacterium]